MPSAILIPLVLAQAEAQPQSPGLGMMPALLVIGILFYFIIFRAERKKQKAMRQSLERVARR